MGVNAPSTYKCGTCGVFGHNARTCGVIKNDLLPVPKKTKCGACGKEGHNKRTCPTLKRRRDFLSIHVAVPDTCLLIADEEAMEEDYVLTSDEEEDYVPAMDCGVDGEEDLLPFGATTTDCHVDIATDGYTGILLCDDVLMLVGQQVEAVRGKFTRDYHEGRVWMGYLADKETGMKWSGEGFKILRAIKTGEQKRLGYLNAETDHHVGDTWRECGKQIASIRGMGDSRRVRRGSVSILKMMKWDYIKRDLDFAKNTYGNGWYSWYHTLAERERIAMEQAGRRRGA